MALTCPRKDGSGVGAGGHFDVDAAIVGLDMFQLGMVLEAESTHYAVAPCYGKSRRPLLAANDPESLRSASASESRGRLSFRSRRFGSGSGGRLLALAFGSSALACFGSLACFGLLACGSFALGFLASALGFGPCLFFGYEAVKLTVESIGAALLLGEHSFEARSSLRSALTIESVVSCSRAGWSRCDLRVARASVCLLRVASSALRAASTLRAASVSSAVRRERHRSYLAEVAHAAVGVVDARCREYESYGRIDVGIALLVAQDGCVG